MSLQTVQLETLRGMNQSQVDWQSSGIFQMESFRQTATQRGRLEVCPYFYQKHQLAQGTYWDGAASAVEPSGSSVTLATTNFYATAYCFSTGSVQIQAFWQTTQPVANTIYTGCRLVINNVAALAVNLGATVDVEMTGAAAFRWRKNGGAWTAGVPAITGVAIDGGNATLYFLANSGFAGTETWSWTRTDRAYDGAPPTYEAQKFRYYKGNLYFNSRCNRMMVAQMDTLGVRYVVTLGYRAVYGVCFTFFYDHLVVGGFSLTLGAFSQNPWAKTVGWSDVNDVHNFIPTDLNEADSYTFPNDTTRDVLGTTTASYIVEVGVVRNVLYVFAVFGTYQTVYLGLPLVFSFEQSVGVTTPQVQSTIAAAQTENGIYLLTQDDIVFFDGGSPRSIGTPVGHGMREFGEQVHFTPKMKFSVIFYNASTREVYVLARDKRTLFVYQEKWGEWYSRVIAPGSGYGTAVGLLNEAGGYSQNILQIGGVDRKVWAEDVKWNQQPVTLYATYYAPPIIIFQPAAFGSLYNVKEFSGVYIGASFNCGANPAIVPSTSYYETQAKTRIQVYWQDCPSGVLDDFTGFGAWTTDAEAYWDLSKVNGFVPLPRVPSRALAIMLYVTTQDAVGLTLTKPPAYLTVTGVELVGYGIGQDTVKK
jgi:hypothetical protein